MTRGEADNKRTRDVRVRLTENEYARWTTARERSGRREMGAWVRALVEETLTKRRAGRRPGDLSRIVVPEVNVAAVEQLTGVANNLNQLARWANTEQRAPEAERLRALAARVEQLLHEVRGSRPWPDGPVERGDPPVVDEHEHLAVDEPADARAGRRRWWGRR